MEETRKKTYVDALVRVRHDGKVEPLCVTLPDGRMFAVTKVRSVRRHMYRTDFAIMVGEHATALHVERAGWTGPKFYVYLRATDRC